MEEAAVESVGAPVLAELFVSVDVDASAREAAHASWNSRMTRASAAFAEGPRYCFRNLI